MAELATIARPYAEALFRVGRTGDLAAWSDWLDELAAGCRQSRQCWQFADNPKVTDEQVIAICSLSRGEVAAAAPKRKNFLRMLIENGRLPRCPKSPRSSAR